MHNADVLFKEDSTVDDLIDVIEVSWAAAVHSISAARIRGRGQVSSVFWCSSRHGERVCDGWRRATGGT